MPKNNRKPEHYVNNKDFSSAVASYVREVRSAEQEGQEIPQIPQYIGECFLRIAEGLSHKPNFASYTYRDEMVMDAVENCVRAAAKFNPDAETKSGQPNAFAYFTQISYYAFLRRISREKKQQEIKEKYIEESSFDSFATDSDDGDVQYESVIERIRTRRDNL